MKKQFFLLAIMLILGIQSYAQTGVAINTTGNEPDGSAMLDVSSIDKGILIPRMTEAQRTSIALPASGLLVYQNDGTEGFYYYDGSAWTKLASGSFTETDPVFGSSAAHDITTNNISNWNTAYGWGSHSGLYKPVTYFPAWSEITSNPFSFSTLADNQLLKYNSTSGQWENWTPDYLTGFTESDPVFSAWDKSSGIFITESQISDLGDYLDTETDPVFGLSAASGISTTDITNWNNTISSQWISSGSNIYYNAGNVGIGTATPKAPVQLANSVANRKIVLYENQDNDHQFYGLGVNNYTFRYQIPATSASHVFYTGTTETNSTELFRIKGTGGVVIPVLTTAGVLLNNTSGEISSSVGTSGQVLTTNSSGDISWTTPAGGTVTDVGGTAPIVSSGGSVPVISITSATASDAGSMSASDKSKLDNIEDNANYYIHPGGDGNLHVPATGTDNEGKVLTAGPTAGSINWANPTHLVTSVAGKTGAVILNKEDVGLGNVENTALSTWHGSPAIVSVGDISMGRWEAAPIDIERGGTGATAKADAFDALSPMTDEGDIIFGGASGTGSRLEKGSAGLVLMMNEYETAPKWGNPAAHAMVMTQNELLSTENPSEGLMVYCTDCGSSGAHCIFTDNTWNYLFVSSASQSPATPQFEEISYITNGLRWRWKSVQGADAYMWNTTNDYTTAITTSDPILEHDQLGIECNRSYMCYVWAVDNGSGLVSAPLELYDWVETPFVPEERETQLVNMDQIDWKWHNVYNAIGYRFGTSDDYSLATDVGATDHYLETVSGSGIYTRYVWAYNSCGHSDVLVLTFTPDIAAPVAAEAVWVSDTFFWKWNTVPDASGYKWSSSNDYDAANDLGDVTETGEPGLTCGTSYTRYVWAYNLWGHSDASALTAVPGGPVTPENSGSNIGKTQITYNWTPVEGATGYKYSTGSANYAEATDIGNVTTLTRSGLACSHQYEVWVWAYNDCGHSGYLYILEGTGVCTGDGPRRQL